MTTPPAVKQPPRLRDNPLTFSATVTALREAKGWSKPELARKAGLTRQAIQSWERGDTEPGMRAAVRLARALGVTVEYLSGEG